MRAAALAVLFLCGQEAWAFLPTVSVGRSVTYHRVSTPVPSLRRLALTSLMAQEGTSSADERLFPEPPPPKDGDYVDIFCRGIHTA